MSRIISETSIYLASLKLSDAPYIVWLHGDLWGKVAVLSPQPLTEKAPALRCEERSSPKTGDKREEIRYPYPSLCRTKASADCLQPPRCSGFRQQLTPGVGMTSDVKSWRKHSQSVFFSGMSSRYSGPSEEPEPVTSVGCSCWYAWVGSHLTGLRRVPASRSARGFRSASSRRRGLHHTGAAPLPIDVANPLSCESKDDLSVGLIVSPEPAWQAPT